MKREIIESTWTIAGLKGDSQSGTLECYGSDLRLKINIPEASTDEQVFRQAVEQRRGDTSTEIHGLDELGYPIVLFGCHEVVARRTHEIITHVYSALAGIRGLKVNSWKEPFLRTAMLRLDYLHQWLERLVGHPIVGIDGEKGIAQSSTFSQVFDLEPGVKIRIHDGSRASYSAEEITFKADSQVGLHFEEPISLEEFVSVWEPSIVRLFSVLIGLPTRSVEARVFTGDPFFSADSEYPEGGLLLGRSNRELKTDLVAFQMFAPYNRIKEDFAGILQRWSALNDEQRPFLDLFSAVTLGPPLHREAKFLFLVQALEVHHTQSSKYESSALPPGIRDDYRKRALDSLPLDLKDWAEGKLSMNSKSLQQKLSDIFKNHADAVEKIFGTDPDLAGRIAVTRNNLTHGKEPGKKDLKPSEITTVSWGLEALLWIILLREIAAPEAGVNLAVHRAKNVVFVELA